MKKLIFVIIVFFALNTNANTISDLSYEKSEFIIDNQSLAIINNFDNSKPINKFLSDKSFNLEISSREYIQPNSDSRFIRCAILAAFLRVKLVANLDMSSNDADYIVSETYYACMEE